VELITSSKNSKDMQSDDASEHHIIHATDNHFLQVFLGQQGFPAGATSFIIWLSHFPEELHSIGSTS